MESRSLRFTSDFFHLGSCFRDSFMLCAPAVCCFLLLRGIPVYGYGAQAVYPCTCWWVFELLSVLTAHQRDFYEHWYPRMCGDRFFLFHVCKYPGIRMAGSKGECIRHHWAVFQGGFPGARCQQQCRKSWSPCISTNTWCWSVLYILACLVCSDISLCFNEQFCYSFEHLLVTSCYFTKCPLKCFTGFYIFWIQTFRLICMEYFLPASGLSFIFLAVGKDQNC